MENEKTLRDQLKTNISNPTRPCTPATNNRSLFQSDEYISHSRPGTSANRLSAKQNYVGLNALRTNIKREGKSRADIWTNIPDSPSNSNDSKISDSDLSLEQLMEKDYQLFLDEMTQLKETIKLFLQNKDEQLINKSLIISKTISKHLGTQDKDIKIRELRLETSKMLLSQLNNMSIDCIFNVLLIFFNLYMYVLPSDSEYDLFNFLCQNLFTQSQNNINDDRFISIGLLEPLVRICSVSVDSLDISRYGIEETIPLDSFIYVIGCIKNLSNNIKIQNICFTKGLLKILSQCIINSHELLKILNLHDNFPSNSQNEISRKISQLIAQILGTYRNYIRTDKYLEDLFGFQIFQQLLIVLETYLFNYELTLLISRIISVLSEKESCRTIISSNTSFMRFFVQSLEIYPDKYPLLTRFLFIMGNLTVNSDDNRILIGLTLGGMRILIDLLNKLVNILLRKDMNSSDEFIDSIIKLLRLLANLSVNNAIGYKLACNNHISIIFTLFNTDISLYEELLLTVLSLITNISYYGDINNHNIIWNESNTIIRNIFGYLSHSNEEIIYEVVRIFGNLSRTYEVRKQLIDMNFLQISSQLLSHEFRGIVYSIVGTLMNIVSDSNLKLSLTTHGSSNIDHLIQILEISNYKDIQMSLVILKTFYNYFAINDSSYGLSLLITPAQIECLLSVLSKLKEEGNNIQLPEDSNLRIELTDFYDILTDLLDILESLL